MTERLNNTPEYLSKGLFKSANDEQTGNFGKLVSTFVEPGDVLVLTGDLGAGKTRFSRGFAEGLGIERSVTSPTFVIHNSYPDGRVPLEHLDLYRITSSDQLYEIDLGYVFESGGVTLIEWGDRFPDELPTDILTIAFIREDIVADAAQDSTSEPARLISLSASGERSEELLATITQACREDDHVLS